MGYSISFVRSAVGESRWDALERINAAFDPDEEVVLSVASAELCQRWPALVARIRDAVGDVDTDETLPHLELSTDHPRVRLDLADDDASIRLPYWHLGADAAAAMEIAYRIAAVVETQIGLEAIDAQTGLVPSAATLDEAIASYTGMSKNAERIRLTDGQRPCWRGVRRGPRLR